MSQLVEKAINTFMTMSRVVKIDIIETPEQLKKMMNSQTTARGRSRVQALYLLKIKVVETVQHLAVTLGCERRTIQRWLRQYREGGIEELLNLKTSSRRRASIPDWGA
ncbi:MAG: helix-turn-helix domain-containing protein [Microcoleaceae cyanobacterium]